MRKIGNSYSLVFPKTKCLVTDYLLCLDRTGRQKEREREREREREKDGNKERKIEIWREKKRERV